MSGHGKPAHKGRRNGGRGRRFSRKSPRKTPEGRRDSTGKSPPVAKMFRTFQAELDGRHYRSERLARLGRDVSTESRRIVMLLNSAASADERDQVLQKAHRRVSELNDSLLRDMAAELKGQDYYMYLRAFTVGLQEYVRAVSFFRYLKDGRLVTIDEINNALVFEMQAEEPESERSARSDSAEDTSNKPAEARTFFSLEIMPLEYLYGVADMAGELRRMSVSALGRGDMKEPRNICRFIRDVYSGFVSCGFVPAQSTWRSRDSGHRAWVLLQNVLEVEKTCYAAQLHGPTRAPESAVADVVPLMEELAVE